MFNKKNGEKTKEAILEDAQKIINNYRNVTAAIEEQKNRIKHLQLKCHHSGKALKQMRREPARQGTQRLPVMTARQGTQRLSVMTARRCEKNIKDL